MKLRKLARLCEHDRLEAHVEMLPCPGHFADWPKDYQLSCNVRHELHCPGGDVLADDAILIEPTESGLQSVFDRLVELGAERHDCAKYTAHHLVLRASDNARLKCEWVLP